MSDHNITTIYHFILDNRVGGPHIYVSTVMSRLSLSCESVIVTPGSCKVGDIAIVNLRKYARIFYALEIPLNIIIILYLIISSKIKSKKCIYDVHGSVNVAPLFVARLLRIPVVWHIHETTGSLRLLVNLCGVLVRKTSHKIIVVAASAQDIYKVRDACVVPAPVDVQFWHRDKKRLTTHDQYRKFKLLCVGNLNPLKGVDLLLKSLKKCHLKYELLIVGEELKSHVEYAKLLRKQTDSNLKEAPSCSIVFAGRCSRDEIYKAMNDCDLFILPSRSEASPIALREAMSMECLCVATDVGDVSNSIIDGKTGFLVQPECTDGLVGAIDKALMTGESKKRKLVKNARNHVENSHSHIRIADIHNEIYEMLVSTGENT